MGGFLLTKQTIKKLENATPIVTLCNGCYNVASVKIHNNKLDYEIRVERSFPRLEVYSRVRSEATLTIWAGSRGVVHSPVPVELQSIVHKLWGAADLTDTEISGLALEMEQAVINFVCQMGFSPVELPYSLAV